MPPVRASILAALSLAVACDNPNPGTPLGTFAVTSALATDSCGGSAAEANPGSFDVTISNDQGIVYWFPNDGASGASGPISSMRSVSITEAVADDVDATDGGTSGPCTLTRNDVLSFTLAAGAAPPSFTGAYTFTVSQASGANCSDQLATHGGGYAILPCTVSYRLSGARK